VKQDFVVSFLQKRRYYRMNFLNKLTTKQVSTLKSCIKTEDDALAIRRSQAIILLEERVSKETIEMLTGYKREVAVKIRRTFVSGGVEALRSKRKKKQPRALLTKSQKEQIVHILKTNTPKDFGYSYEFWTTTVLAHLIFEQYGVNYKSKTSIYLIFKEAKFTFHKPEKASERRNKELIEKWRKEKLPIINEECKRKDTVVLVGDEAAISSQTRTQKVWLPSGDTPFVQDTTKRKLAHLYGFLNVQSGKAYTYATAAQTGEVTVSILKKLLRDNPGKRIVIVWDNASWHKSKAVRSFLETTNRFKLYNFPPYAPDLNPQEHIWKEAREKVLNNRLIKDVKIAVRKVIDFINNSIFKYRFFGLHGTFKV